METSETIGQRIKVVRGLLSQKEFGQRIGLSQTAVTALESGQSEPRLSTFNSIVEKFEVNPDWLRTGKSSLVFTTDPSKPVGCVDPEPEPPAGTPAMRVNRGQLVEHADTVLLLSETEQKLVEAEKELTGVKSENQQLAERLKDAKEEILWLRGKSLASSPAADFATLSPLPAPNAIGYHANAERATRAEAFDAYVATRQEQGGVVAELV